MFEDLLSEQDDIVERRKRCSEMLNVLRRAHEIVNEVRDLNPS